MEEGLGLFFIFAFMLIFGALILQKYGFCDEYGNFIALDPADFDNRTSNNLLIGIYIAFYVVCICFRRRV